MAEQQDTAHVRIPAQRGPLRDLPLAGERGRLPVLPRTYIPRARLWQRLDESTRGGGVTLLVAPAGAGKTLGVAGWLLRHRGSGDAEWVSRAGDLSSRRLDRALAPRPGGRAPFVVIDDAHELSPSCLRLIDERLQEDPDSLELVLLTRWDLPLTRLVPELLGHLTILRGDLLRLDPAETAHLVAAHVGETSDDVVASIATKGQGWCAAVVLTARTVAMSRDPVIAARSETTNFSAVDRVAREAFAALSPRQRHVLLCVAEEDIVSGSLARHLSNDPGADSVLDELEDTGLLVTRHRCVPDTLPRDVALDLFDEWTSSDVSHAVYRIHPLLTEVARRRMHAGGVDVERARSTIRRAVDLDVTRGHLYHSLHRLLAASDHEGVVRLLAVHGVPLVLSGEAPSMQSFARQHADLVEAVPASWFTLALERWRSGPDESARSWLKRLTSGSAVGEAGEGAPPEAALACAHLMLALLGDEALVTAASRARDVLGSPTDRGDERWPDLALLQLLLGMVQLRMGDLGSAEQALTSVARVGGPAAAQALRSDALAELAVFEFLRGHEHTVLALAEAAPDAPTASPAGAGLGLAVELSRLQMVVDPEHVPSEAGTPQHTAQPGDVINRFLTLLLRSRRFLLKGLASDAGRLLDAGVEVPDLPETLRAPLLVEKALPAALSADREGLKALESQLHDAGAPGEAAFVAGLRADLSGDVSGAIAEFAVAAEQARCEQPAVAAVASTCRAQLLDAVGQREEALAELKRAVTRTAVRRNVLPFLGWSRHGTSLATLLGELAPDHTLPWAEELAATTSRHPGGITGLAGPVTATPQEKEGVTTEGLRPELSPRERDVLHELARGSTYAGIAANLFVSENTVKTHVSSLYAKLGATRRSEALAVARTLRML